MPIIRVLMFLFSSAMTVIFLLIVPIFALFVYSVGSISQLGQLIALIAIGMFFGMVSIGLICYGIEDDFEDENSDNSG